MMASKPGCDCAVGFCRAAVLLEAWTAEIMAGRQRRDLADAYRAQADRCAGGWRMVPPRDDEHREA
jgi:hypothetical protein